MKITIEEIQPMAEDLISHCQNKLGFEKQPGLFFADDEENGSKSLGKTAYYDPSNQDVVVFITNRHTKDILRSIAHELVHHMQNLRGDFDDGLETGAGYAQKNPKLRKMEAEAYLLGNMMFRDWEDGLKAKKLQEIKEKPKMKLKDIKKVVKQRVLEIMKEQKYKDENEEFQYGRFSDVPGYEKEADPRNWKKEKKVQKEGAVEEVCGKRDDDYQADYYGENFDDEDFPYEPLSDFQTDDRPRDQYDRLKSGEDYDNDPDLGDMLRAQAAKTKSLKSLSEQSKTDLPDRGTRRAQGGRRLDEEEILEGAPKFKDVMRQLGLPTKMDKSCASKAQEWMHSDPSVDFPTAYISCMQKKMGEVGSSEDSARDGVWQESLNEQSKTDLADRGSRRAQGGRRLDEEGDDVHTKMEQMIVHRSELIHQHASETDPVTLQGLEMYIDGLERKIRQIDPDVILRPLKEGWEDSVGWPPEERELDLDDVPLNRHGAGEESEDSLRPEDFLSRDEYEEHLRGSDPEAYSQLMSDIEADKAFHAQLDAEAEDDFLQEGKIIKTPEQESALYKSRFGNRNKKLFNKPLR